MRVLQDRLTLTRDIIAGTKCAPATGKDKHSDYIVRHAWVMVSIKSRFIVSQTIQSLGRVELIRDTRLAVKPRSQKNVLLSSPLLLPAAL